MCSGNASLKPCFSTSPLFAQVYILCNLCGCHRRPNLWAMGLYDKGSNVICTIKEIFSNFNAFYAKRRFWRMKRHFCKKLGGSIIGSVPTTDPPGVILRGIAYLLPVSKWCRESICIILARPGIAKHGFGYMLTPDKQL